MTKKKNAFHTRSDAPLSLRNHGTESATRGVTFEHLFNLYRFGDCDIGNGLKLTELCCDRTEGVCVSLMCVFVCVFICVAYVCVHVHVCVYVCVCLYVCVCWGGA